MASTKTCIIKRKRVHHNYLNEVLSKNHWLTENKDKNNQKRYNLGTSKNQNGKKKLHDYTQSKSK